MHGGNGAVDSKHTSRAARIKQDNTFLHAVGGPGQSKRQSKSKSTLSVRLASMQDTQEGGIP